REQRLDMLAALFHHHELAADDIAAGALVFEEFRQRGVVGTAVGGAVARARVVAEARSRAEVGTFGHDAGIGQSITQPLRATAADRSRREARAAAIAGGGRPAWGQMWPTNRPGRDRRAAGARARG